MNYEWTNTAPGVLKMEGYPASIHYASKPNGAEYHVYVMGKAIGKGGSLTTAKITAEHEIKELEEIGMVKRKSKIRWPGFCPGSRREEEDDRD